jgi:hypothetical protein
MSRRIGVDLEVVDAEFVDLPDPRDLVRMLLSEEEIATAGVDVLGRLQHLRAQRHDAVVSGVEVLNP